MKIRIYFLVCLEDHDRHRPKTSAANSSETAGQASHGLIRHASEPPKKGGILAALRRSPLVGADLNLTRSRDTGRTIDF